jgi:hypothetical protein
VIRTNSASTPSQASSPLSRRNNAQAAYSDSFSVKLPDSSMLVIMNAGNYEIVCCIPLHHSEAILAVALSQSGLRLK